MAAIVTTGFVQFSLSIEAGRAFQRARKADDSGRHQEAFLEYERAREVYPNSENLNTRRAVNFLKLRRYDDAAKAIGLVNIQGKDFFEAEEIRKITKEALAGQEKERTK